MNDNYTMEHNYDYNYCNGVEKITLRTKERYNEIMNKDNYTSLFDDYIYYNRDAMNNKHKENFNTETRFKNPHLKYEIEHDLELEKESRRMSGDDDDTCRMLRYKQFNQSSTQILKKNNSYIGHNASYIKENKSLYSKYMTGRMNNNSANNIDDNNLLMYYKNNKKTNGHQRNFSSNSTNLNSIK